MRYLEAGKPPQDGLRGRDDEGPRPAQAFRGRGALSEALRDGRAAVEEKPKRRYRSWKTKSDDEVAGIAQEVIDRHAVSCRTRLWEVDAGLADRLRERGLWGKIRFCGTGNGKNRAATAEHVPAPAKAPAKEAEPAEERCRPPAEPFSRDEVVFLAQSAIDEIGISGMGELARLDAELHNLVAESGVQERLRFAPAEKANGSTEESTVGGAVCSPGGNGAGGPAGKGPEGADGRLLGLSAEQLRKADLHGRETGEEEMFRLIFAECFRVGTGNPYLGSMRGTIPKLQSNMNRRLSGRQHRLFRKCWARMESESVITYNHNRTAASVDIGTRGLREAGLVRALSWASAEQMKVGPEWVAAFGADT